MSPAKRPCFGFRLADYTNWRTKLRLSRSRDNNKTWNRYFTGRAAVVVVTLRSVHQAACDWINPTVSAYCKSDLKNNLTCSAGRAASADGSTASPSSVGRSYLSAWIQQGFASIVGVLGYSRPTVFFLDPDGGVAFQASGQLHRRKPRRRLLANIILGLLVCRQRRPMAGSRPSFSPADSGFMHSTVYTQAPAAAAAAAYVATWRASGVNISAFIEQHRRRKR